jgi:intein/homing endonuclease
MKTIVSKKEFLDTYKYKTWGIKALNICDKKEWLPLKPTHFLASIVGRLMGDGNLSKDRMVGDFRFYGDLLKLDKIKLNLKKYFGIIPYSYYVHPKGGGYILKYNNAIFSRILELSGVPRGNKILNSFKVPKWIMEGNKKVKKAFLSAIFSDEMGRIAHKQKNTWKGLEFGMSKIKSKSKDLIFFLNQLKIILDEFGVTSSDVILRKNRVYFRKDGHITYPARFYLHCNLNNRKRFYSNIGFDDEVKQKLLYSSIKPTNA